ncbi:ATP-binding protein [Micromonospora sp. CPCC 206061]|uniref:ATP-binding protein n=1 Tax=Micromonospora sp. CPCC 206061 TaxID=3122410 RepID=UPI002FEED4AB
MGPWHFVGRADELRRLVTAATSGTGRGLILSGTAGIGKSRLLREGVASLPTHKYAVWTAAANIAAAGLPFGGLAQVLPADQPAGVSPAGLLRWAVEALHHQAAGRPIVLAVHHRRQQGPARRDARRAGRLLVGRPAVAALRRQSAAAARAGHRGVRLGRADPAVRDVAVDRAVRAGTPADRPDRRPHRRSERRGARGRRAGSRSAYRCSSAPPATPPSKAPRSAA